MGNLILIELTTNSKDGAGKALDTVRRLDHEHWIELIDYAAISKDEKGRTTLRELDDEHAEKISAAATGVAGAIAGGGFGGPAGAIAGAAVGAAVGAGSIRLTERLVRDKSLQDISGSLTNDSSMLAVVVEESYAERIEEELQNLGQVVEREMKREEREAELNAYIARSKVEIESLQTKIKTKLANANSATQADRLKIEGEIATARAELDFKREQLEDHIKAVSADLKSDIHEMKSRLQLSGQAAKYGIASSLDGLHRQMNYLHDELQQIIEDQIDALEEEASELKVKAAHASGDAKTAIENHLSAVQARIRRTRTKMRFSFEERLLQAKKWFQILHVRAALAKADARDKLESGITTAQHAFAEFKASMHARKQEDARAWKDIRAGFNKAWQDLADAFDRATGEKG